jgi:uncharacterized protein (TIGR04255 family)
MAINEVFPNPTVKQVIFQIRFPNLFYIESKIGEFQMRIMEEFPESSMLFRQPVMLADLGSKTKNEEVASHLDEQWASKIWQFSSPKKIQLNVLTDSLDLTSQFHKTYKNPGAPHKFRDAIKFVLDNFFDVTNIPIIHRVGLRYVDECPVLERTNDLFQKYYNTTFPVDRFAVQDADEMLFKTVVRKGEYRVRYVEALQPAEKGGKLILDFDAFITNVKAQDCLTVTDNLHDFILEEYEKTIKAPVIEYMRKIGEKPQ